MRKVDNNAKIEKYLDELSEEYKELLLKRLVDNSGDFENLSASELLRIDNEIKRPLLIDYRKNKRKQKMMFKIGMIYASFGFVVLLVYAAIKIDAMDGITLVAGLLTIFGLLMSLGSSMYSTIYERGARDNVNTDESLEYEVVKNWRELEGIATDIYSDLDNIKVGSIIIRFVDDGYISEDEANTLKQLLATRNSIVHNMDEKYDSKQLLKLLSNVEVIKGKLKEHAY